MNSTTTEDKSKPKNIHKRQRGKMNKKIEQKKLEAMLDEIKQNYQNELRQYRIYDFFERELDEMLKLQKENKEYITEMKLHCHERKSHVINYIINSYSKKTELVWLL